MTIQTVNAPPAPAWAPANYQLKSYVLTDAKGNARVMVVNAKHAESVNLAWATVNGADKSTFAFAGIIDAIPQPKAGQFEIVVDIQENASRPPTHPKVIRIVKKIMDTVAEIAIVKAREAGFPTDKVIVFLAQVRPGSRAVTTDGAKVEDFYGLPPRDR